MIYPAQYRRSDGSTLSDLSRLNRMMDRLFGETAGSYDSFPSVNIHADEETAVLTAELPGFELGDLKITVKANYVTLEGERKQPEYEEQVTVHRSERGYGRFIRSVTLPYEIENDKVKATYKNGILRVELPRAEASKPRQIQISAE